jgi:hypothetical protein
MLFQMALSVKAKGKTNKRWSLVVYLGGWDQPEQKNQRDAILTEES